MQTAPVPTVVDARAHLVRWWTTQVVTAVIVTGTVLGGAVEAVLLPVVAAARPEWLQGMGVLMVATLAVGMAGIAVQLAFERRLHRERDVTARHGWKARLVLLVVFGTALGALALGFPLVPMVVFPTLGAAARGTALALERALDAGRVDRAERLWAVQRWLVLYRGVGGRLLLERGDRDAASRALVEAEQDPVRGGRAVWLQHRVRALLEQRPDQAIDAAEGRVRARPMDAESHELLALCQLERGCPDDQTLPRLELALEQERRLLAVLLHPHGPAILAATIAWAHAVANRPDLARQCVDRAPIPTSPVPAAEVQWRLGRALLACGDPAAARARFERGAGTVGWAGRRCAAELARTRAGDPLRETRPS